MFNEPVLQKKLN